jgi:hypothetical protein
MFEEIVFVTFLNNMVQTLQMANETIRQQQVAIEILLNLLAQNKI